MNVHSHHVGVYTPADPPRIHVPPQIVRIVLAANVSYLLAGLRATLAALPIALIAVSGPLRVIGIVYLIGWFVALSPSTGVYMLATVATTLRKDMLLFLLRRMPCTARERCTICS